MVEYKQIKNSNKFREPAITFDTYGYYTSAAKGTKQYFDYWDEQMNRCLNGYKASDGDFITGYHYFYLNFCPITRLVHRMVTNELTGEVKDKTFDAHTFPDFHDYDYFFFLGVEEAEATGHHVAALKSRRKGYSLKASSMADRNFYLIPNSKTYIYTSDKTYLTGDGILTKAWAYMDFIDENTAWAKKRQKGDTMFKRRASVEFTDEYGNKIEKGYKSEIIGATLGGNPNKVRGKRGKLIIFEEAGSFKELGDAWQIARPSVEQDGETFGLLLAFGCVCAGTKVVTNKGDVVNVEDLEYKDGIMGYNSYEAVPQLIRNINKPSEKHCVEITTNTGKQLRCSVDHPILWSTKTMSKRVPGKRATGEHMKSYRWNNAGDIRVGEQVGIIDSVPIFGEDKMWEPRLVGMLIGDGSYGFDKTPVMSNCDSEINKYIYDRYDCMLEKEYITKDNKHYKETRIKGICPELRKLGIYGQTKKAKRLPINIHKYDANSLSELIGGLFDTDGYIRVSKDTCRLVLTSISRDMLMDVQGVLIKFGIHSCVRFISGYGRVRERNGHRIVDNGHYRLEISDKKSLIQFSKHIELLCEYKQCGLDALDVALANRKEQGSKYVHGMRFERVVGIRDIGIQKIYNLTTNDTHTYIANWFITHNTGGDEASNFATLRDMFYNPEAYNCLGFENIWDLAPGDKKCGFFIPQYANLDNRRPDGTRLYMDKDGNTLVDEAKKYILELRKNEIEQSSNSAAVDRYIAERPITPSEAMLQFGGNIFPKKELQDRLALIRTNTKLQGTKQVGDLHQTPEGRFVWTQKKFGDITSYPLDKKEDPTGSIVIWEHPEPDPPYGLYIIGVDPYDFDQSGTNSLGSCLVYKRFMGMDSYSDMIVAEYTGRPPAAEDFYEGVMKLALYYNANVMYENEKKGLYTYFATKHSDYLLADQPSILNDVIKNMTVNRKKGCHMNKQIKLWGEGLIKDWLLEKDQTGMRQLDKILSEPLLEELIQYYDDGNFDRVMALMQVLVYREQMYNTIIQEKVDDNHREMFFGGPIFTNEDDAPDTRAPFFSFDYFRF